ncbi:MAG: hypothetical protein WC109_03950 [Syntrophomonadaceae bacterium]|nr:hypothetical protein [Syntrophomonadaceae bacterium]MDD3897712.1 hypothetical protein [Syntrophomonadaceae bacterium]MDD4562128.1 hypothetical protein [Syntrophomonadaceae bacterium]
MKPVLWKKIVIVIAVVLVLLLLAFLFFTDKPDQQATCDLNHDGIMESYHLTRGKLNITQPDGINWSSPPEWNVQSFTLDDVTRDGNPELIMLLWKRGSFDRHKPLWQEQEKNNYSCHLFVYRLIENKLIPRWCSSALDRPIKSFSIEKNSSGHTFLAVEEGCCSTYCAGRPIIIGKEHSNWIWKQWGFYRM